MDIVGGFDVHRKQITFDYIEMETGELHRGKIRPATRESLREWLDEFTERFSGKQAAIAVEATTAMALRRRGAPKKGLDSSLTWRNRRRAGHCKAARSEPRPTGSMPDIYGT